MNVSEPPEPYARVVVGIDPGIKGAAGVLVNGRPIQVIDLPVLDGQIDAGALRDWVSVWNPDLVAIEKNGAMPKQGLASTFKFGYTSGVITGAMAGFTVERVRSQEWKKFHDLAGKGKDLPKLARKDLARQLAISLYPDMASELKRKLDVDRAEALLIGAYCDFQLQGGSHQE